MSERARNGLFVGAIVALSVVLLFTVSLDPATQSRVESIGARIKCPVCQGESISDSPSQMAQDMMALVEERVEQGATDSEIEEELLAAYSGAVLLDPPFEGRTIALWLAPVVASMVGVTVIARWRRQRPADEERVASEAPASKRVLIGALLLVGSIAVIVVVATTSLQERDGASAGIAANELEDLADASNETLEAVIAANSDHPQINGMRLALAERYFEAGDYRAALPHYLEVRDSDRSTRAELVMSLVRLGWIVYDANGEVEIALGLFDRALEIEPGSQVALYLKGTVLWCGGDDSSQASNIFTSLLGDPDLPDDSRLQIEEDLGRVQAGEACI